MVLVDQAAMTVARANQARSAAVRSASLVTFTHDRALLYARAGVARSRQTRSDYYQPTLALTLDGVNRVSAVWRKSIEIVNNINEQPDTLQLTLRSQPGFTPVPGQEIVLGLGDISNRFFAGHVLLIGRQADKKSQRANWILNCIDYTWSMDEEKFSKRYGSQSATAIITDIVSSYTTGFTVTNVVAAMPSVDMEFSDVFPSEAITRVMNAVNGFWYVDYNKDVHAFISETTQAPAPVTDGNVRYWGLTYEADLSQIRTRVYVEGGGGTCTTYTAAGTTSLPVSECVWYPASGSVKTGPQVVTYTGRSAVSGPGTLTGIPASGAGSIQYAVAVDDVVSLWVQRDNVTLQTALAALTGRSGVRAMTIQDRRLSLAGAQSRGDEQLATYGSMLESLTYTTRDKFARSGKALGVSLPGLTVGTYKIQSVRISAFNTKRFPVRKVAASTVRSPADLLDLLRQLSGGY